MPGGAVVPLGNRTKAVVSGGRDKEYYETMFFLLLQHANSAQSILDVGSGAPPFLEHVTW
jgi:hypothetical protein